MSENKPYKKSGVKESSTKDSKKKSYSKSVSDSAKGKKTVKHNESAQNRSKTTQKKTNKSTKKSVPAVPLKVIPLGGLEEIGKNLTVFECENDIIIVDCGMSFPDEDMPGIDLVIPDFTYLIKNKDKIRGLFVTHGHEDHIGGIPYLLKELKIPIYGTKLTVGLISGKLAEHGLSTNVLNERKPGDIIKAGCFSIELIHVNHSIPDSVGMAIRCPAGLFVHTGDFKVDMTPIDGEVIDLARFGQLGDEGVTALFMDSTNAERPGYTQTERVVGNTFSSIFARSQNKRIIVATFSSNIHRIQQVINEAAKYGRKVAVSGRSMVNTVAVASELGYLNVPEGLLIDIDMIRRYKAEDTVIITTGSQGEAMSALHRMAFSDHKKVAVGPGDVIIISANPIPGNEKLVSRVINELLKLGAEVVFESMYDVHVSGHACAEELKLIMGLTKPKFFMPLHGEYRHLYSSAKHAQSMGMERNHIMIAQLGNVIEFTSNSMRNISTVQAGKVFVDGLGVGDVGSIVLRDRKHLSEDGLIAVVMSIDKYSGEVVSGPELISRGFVYVRESEQMLDEARTFVCRILDECSRKDWAYIKTKVRDDLSRYIFDRTRRSPMILPIIMEV